MTIKAEEIQIKYYDDIYANNSTATSSEFDIKSYFHRRFLNIITAGNCRHILEVGCGDGTLTAYLLEKGHKVYGLDISPRGIEKLKEKFSKEVSSGQLIPICDDAINFMKQTDIKFDVVMGSGIIHHIEQSKLQEFFSSARLSLKENGLFACAPEPNSGGLYHLFWKLAPFIYNKLFRISYDAEVEKGTFFMKPQFLKQKLKAAGFREQKILPFQSIFHFSIKWLAMIDSKLVDKINGRFAAYIMVMGIK